MPGGEFGAIGIPEFKDIVARGQMSRALDLILTGRAATGIARSGQTAIVTAV